MKVQPEVLVPKSEQQQSIMPVFASLYSVSKAHKRYSEVVYVFFYIFLQVENKKMNSDYN